MKDDRTIMEEMGVLSDAELKERLRLELEKTNPDGNSVRTIMRMVRKRDAEQPQEIPAQVEAAWKELEEKVEQETDTPKTYKHRATWNVGKIVVIAAVMCVVVFAVPLAFGAENVVQLVASWTDEVFHFARPGETTQAQKEYVFQTDHPGLQEIYDTVFELGVTDPVVPMWIPDGYELTEIKLTELNGKTKVAATLYNDDSKIVFLIHIGEIGEELWHEKDDEIVDKREINSITHYIMSNNNEWLAVWELDSATCCITVSTKKSDIMEILESVYAKE